MIKAFLFDMDGVLVNSEVAYMQQDRLFMNEYHIPYDEDIIKSFVGSTDQYQMEYMTKYFPKEISYDEVCQLFHDFNLEHPIDYASIVNPHIQETMTYLKNRGYHIALATNSTLRHAERVTKICKAYDYLEQIITGVDLHKPKPDPAIYLESAKRLGVNPEECVCIEDSKYGIESGKNAGMIVIALKDQYFDTNQEEANYVIEDLIEICDIEKRL